MKQPIPDTALDDRLGFVGTAGSGKSYNAMGRVERLLERKARVCCVDPLGVFWGLRLGADGKALGFHIPIFGGPHGDLPLTEMSGALIGETVAGMAESCIIDLSEIGTKAGERRFMLHFLTALYRKANGEPLHLVIDEADMFAPQKINDKEGEAAKLLGMMETVVRRGRIKGFIPWLITQRPAVIAKDVLSQVDGLVAFKLTSSQDRDALSAWVEGSADKADWKAMRDALPGMERGSGIVWIPGRSVFETVAFPPKLTFDSSRTPKRGEKKSTADLKPLDLGSLKERLAKVDADRKADDPKALRAEIAKLKQATKNPMAAEDLAEVQRRAFAAGVREYQNPIAGAYAVFTNAWMASKSAREKLERAIEEFSKVVDVALEYRAAPKPHPRATAVPQPRSRTMAPTSNGDGALPKGERMCLAAIAQRQDAGITRQHLTVITGYKRSTRDAYLQRLREKGMIDQSGERIVPTDIGIDALGDFAPLPTGEALQEHVLGTLPEGERAVLSILIPAYPEGLDRDSISEATGYKRSTRDAYIQRLSTRELIDASRGGVISASPDLFA